MCPVRQRMVRDLASGVAVLVVAAGAPARGQGPVGLEAIERFEQISSVRYGVRTYQYSSHDPSGGNNDSSNYLYTDGDERVMLDVKGPGCICRFWFTGSTEGRIRIYFDGETYPRVDMTRASFFSGANAPFLAPLVGNDLVSSGGYYCYLPMPFREGCRMVSTGDPHYYNVTYQRFADAGGVTTFTGNEDTSVARAVWTAAGVDPKPDPGETVLTGSRDLSPGASSTLADLAGPGVIQRIEFTMPGLTSGWPWDDLLMGLRLECYWEGSAEPAVDAPVADFFGSGVGHATVTGLPAGMNGIRLYCYFPMPFTQAALVRLVNDSGVSVNSLNFTIRYTALADPLQGVGRFHARFMSETPTTYGRDYLILEETGAGHLVGVVQTIHGTDTERWYLEGDERIYVDGRLTPDLYGTGTEDFYNGGWYFARGAFTLPVHGCPRRNYTAPYFDTCYRFFLSDLIPFTTSIRVGIEHGAVNEVAANIRSVALYYKASHPLAQLTDELDVRNPGSEAGHGYLVTGETWSGTTTSTYEGDDDDVVLIDDGRRHAGTSRFTMAVSPQANIGALLRRRMDHAYPNQEARVYVDDQLVGTWYEAGQNPSHRFRDSEFMIPASFTRLKDAIAIRIEDASPSSDWTEYRYRLYTLLPVGPAIGLSPSVLTPTVYLGAPSAQETFTVVNEGDGTLDYTISTDADWIALSPEGGSTSGEHDTIEVTYTTGNLGPGTHEATITVSDVGAVNSPQTLGVTLEVRPYPADLDHDFDVDQEDYGLFQVCLSGPGVPQPLPECAEARLDGDGDVDGQDFVLFEGCMSGPDQVADPACTDG